MTSTRQGPNHAHAVAIYKGNGTPRDRELITRDVELGLDAAHERGKLEGERAARERALREMLAIARGLEQDARNRVLGLERELADWLKTIGKTTT